MTHAIVGMAGGTSTNGAGEESEPIAHRHIHSFTMHLHTRSTASRGRANPVGSVLERAGMPLEPRSIDAISFDYGHVLGGFDLEELAARLVTYAQAHHLPPPSGSIEALANAMPEAYARHDRAIEAGAGHEGGWRALVAVMVEAGLGQSVVGDVSGHSRLIDDVVETLWAAQPLRNLWRYVPQSARAMLDLLSQHSIPMVITSNSEGRVAELLAEVGIAHHFVAILDSGRLGFGKPDGRIFALAAERLNTRAARIVHVGDSEAADIVGALQAGFRAVRFDGFVPSATGRPSVADAVVDDHPALTSLLLAASEARR
jgi:HAD superfamily hydrolase (TIGR01549 family)